MVFVDEFLANQSQIRSVLDYSVEIQKLPIGEQNYQALTGNFSVAGFRLTLERKISHYIITCYLPSAMFVIVSWISFLIPADIVPGRWILFYNFDQYPNFVIIDIQHWHCNYDEDKWQLYTKHLTWLWFMAKRNQENYFNLLQSESH